MTMKAYVNYLAELSGSRLLKMKQLTIIDTPEGPGFWESGITMFKNAIEATKKRTRPIWPVSEAEFEREQNEFRKALLSRILDRAEPTP